MNDHVSSLYVASALGVAEATVNKWARHGRFFAEKRGRQWYIPRADAMLFITEYGKRVGSPLVVDTETRVSTYRPQHETRATMDQHLNINVPAWLLRTIDDLRREEEKPRTRNQILVDALTEWTQQERRKRRKKKTA